MMSVLGKWTANGLPRPAWSNAGGTVRYLILCVRWEICLILAVLATSTSTALGK